MDVACLPRLAPPDASWRDANGVVPPSGKLVSYRTAYYQMTGYVNAHGHWVGYDGMEEHLKVEWWRELGQSSVFGSDSFRR